jgi:hypothetical protein
MYFCQKREYIVLMYPNSPLPVKIVINVYVYITSLTYVIFRRTFWPVHVPSYKWTKPVNRTTKEEYKIDHSLYRSMHSSVMGGEQFQKTYYYYYRALAKKYDWPYVKEVYDND